MHKKGIDKNKSKLKKVVLEYDSVESDELDDYPYREMEKWESDIFKAVLKDDVDQFKAALTRFDSLKKKKIEKSESKSEEEGEDDDEEGEGEDDEEGEGEFDEEEGGESIFGSYDFDEDDDTYTLNTPTYVRRWIKHDDFKHSLIKFTLFSFVCYTGNTKIFDLLKIRCDVKFLAENFDDSDYDSDSDDDSNSDSDSDDDDEDDSDDMKYFGPHFHIMGHTKVPTIMTTELFDLCRDDLTEGTRSPLYLSVYYEKIDFIKLMLNELSDDINVNEGHFDDDDEMQFSPLHIACKLEDTKTIKMLLDHNKTDINAGYEPPILVACASGNYDIVARILSVPNVQINKNSEKSALYYACQSGNIEIVKELLKFPNIDINAGDFSPLAASACISLEMTQLLLSQKDIQVNGGKYCALYRACEVGKLKIVKELLSQKNINVNCGYTDENGNFYSCLYGSCVGNKLGIFKLLLNTKGIDVNKGDYTPLSYTITDSNFPFFKMLLKRKEIDVNKGKLSPLRACCISTHESCIDFAHELFKTHQKKIDINKSDIETNRITPLYSACECENLTMVEYLIFKRGININKGLEEDNGNTKTPLYVACVIGDPEIVKVLLERKKIIDVNKGELTPLHGAVKGGFGDIVCELLKHEKIDINKGVISPLTEACIGGDYDIVVSLLRRQEIDVNILSFNENDKRVTALYNACENGEVDIVEELLKKEKIDVNKGEITPLFISCENGYIEIVIKLLQMPLIDVNKLYKYHNEIEDITMTYSNLHAAVESDDVEIVKTLLERSELNVNNGTESALVLACTNRNIPIVRLLLSKEELDVNKMNVDEFQWGITPLYESIECGDVVLFKLLMQRKDIDVNLGDSVPLIGAAKNGDTEMVDLLLENKNIDVNKLELQDTGKCSALYQSCSNEYPDIALKLLQHPNIQVNSGDLSVLKVACENGLKDIVVSIIPFIDINLLHTDENDDEYSSLYYASSKGHIEIVKILLEREEININSGNYTPLHGASSNGYIEVVKLLITHKADKNKGLYSPLYGAVSESRMDIVKELLKYDDVVVDIYILDCAIGKFDIFKELLKRKEITSSVLTTVFEICCLKNLKDFVILMCMRNIHFDKKRIMKVLKKKGQVRKVVEEFLKSKSIFRNKYGSLEKYDIGFNVREFYKAAIVLGMNEYEHLSVLRTPKRDAEEIEKLLKRNKFHFVQSYLNCDCEDLIDLFDLFVSEVKELIEKEENKYKSLLLMLFYAGHGVTFESESLLLPTDFKTKFFALPIHKLRRKCLAVSKIKTSFTSFQRESVNIIVLDACRSVVSKEIREKINDSEGGTKKKVTKNVEHIKTRDGITGNVITKTSRANFVYCFSTDPKAVALDSALIDDKSENSPFTRAMIENLNKKGNFEDILKNVRNRTMFLTQNNQKSWINSSLSFPIMWNDDFEGGGSKLKKKRANALKAKKNIMKKRDGNISAKKMLKQQNDRKFEMEKKKMKNEIEKWKLLSKSKEKIVSSLEEKIKEMEKEMEKLKKK